MSVIISEYLECMQKRTTFEQHTNQGAVIARIINTLTNF